MILYCGDHDPSGQEIPRVVQDQLDRLCDFDDITVRVIALTSSQVGEHNPPPQPAKPTDARYWRYVEEHNMTDVWELDALPPDVLADIAQTAVEEWLPDDYSDIVESDTTTRPGRSSPTRAARCTPTPYPLSAPMSRRPPPIDTAPLAALRRPMRKRARRRLERRKGIVTVNCERCGTPFRRQAHRWWPSYCRRRDAISRFRYRNMARR